MGSGLSSKQEPGPQARRRRRPGDLSRAIYLRPVEIYELYGISPSKLHELCTDPDPKNRLPSKLIVGTGGRKGMRLIEHAALRRWLDKFDQSTGPIEQL